MGPIWGWWDPGGPHVGPMNFAIWDIFPQEGIFSKCQQSHLVITTPKGTVTETSPHYTATVIVWFQSRSCSPVVASIQPLYLVLFRDVYGADIFSFDQAALWMVQLVCQSITPFVWPSAPAGVSVVKCMFNAVLGGGLFWLNGRLFKQN